MRISDCSSDVCSSDLCLSDLPLLGREIPSVKPSLCIKALHRGPNRTNLLLNGPKIALGTKHSLFRQEVLLAEPGHFLCQVVDPRTEIGRASFRERVCQYV